MNKPVLAVAYERERYKGRIRYVATAWPLRLYGCGSTRRLARRRLVAHVVELRDSLRRFRDTREPMSTYLWATLKRLERTVLR